MTMGHFDPKDQAPLAEINMIPLIDVMLVLLVIFIITAPLLTHAIKVDLPKASSQPNIVKTATIQLAIKEDNSLYWNGAPVTLAGLPPRFNAAARLRPQPELHLRADRLTPYERIARIMSMAARSGLSRIGFVTDPGDSGS